MKKIEISDVKKDDIVLIEADMSERFVIWMTGRVFETEPDIQIWQCWLVDDNQYGSAVHYDHSKIRSIYLLCKWDVEKSELIIEEERNAAE